MINTRDKISIATTSLYNLDSESDKVRAEISLETVKTARQYGYEINIVDGGSPKELVAQYVTLGAKVYDEAIKGMGPGRRQVIQISLESSKDVILWMEIEKVGIIKYLSELAKPIILGEADMVIPKRKSLKSYPKTQQYAEPLGNLLWKTLTGEELDVWFGPKLFNQETSQYFLNYSGEYGDKWDSIMMPVMDALYGGKKVISYVIDYEHPKKQTKVEEGNLELDLKRIEQLSTLANPLIKHWKKINCPRY